MHRQARAAMILVAASVLGACAGGPAPSTPAPNGGGDDETKTIAEVTESSRRIDGLFTLFQDTVTGESHLLIRPDQIDREYIYFAHTVDGVVDVGHFRGNFRDNKVVSVRRHFDRILFVTEPTGLHFEEGNALARAAQANISPAVLVSAKIVARDAATGEVLIAADPLFETETFSQVKPSSWPGYDGFELGSLSEDRTRVVEIRGYPLNTDIVVDYVFEERYPTNGGGDGVVDPRYVTIRLQHSLIDMPENGYQPRIDDPRVGYFFDRQTDMLSTSATPYRDLINRWHLEKRDPSAAMSQPVEPIVWWIENTTPLEFRDAIREGVLAWNRAFEEAGFRNALEVRVQPDDADWDAGDIRYNVLRWTSSPNPPFGGYGPSFTNPRTGQILGADIMLEYVYVTNRVRYDRLFSTAALGSTDPFEGAAVEAALDPLLCSYGISLHQSTLFGLHALRAGGASDVEMSELVHQGLVELTMHEVGHTLGLNHNMRGTQARSPEQMHDVAFTRREGLHGSVMDYNAISLAWPGQPQGQYYGTTVGPYDVWAIEFGYSTGMEQPEAEAARLETILARSTDPELAFGNDADDMRSPGKAIDPRVNTDDLTNDAIGWATERMRLADHYLDGLLEQYREPGDSWHALRNAYLILTGQQGNAAGVVSRYIGGVYVDRAMQDQYGATRPFTPVPRADQERAMATLASHVFAPDAFSASPELLAHLAMQRRGFDFFSGTEDPKLHSRVLNIQRGVLNHVLHPVVLTRITDSRLYGNEYPVAEVLADLTGAIFDADGRTNVNTMRQALQVEYIQRLARIIDDEEGERYDAIAKSAALQQLRWVDAMLARRPAGNLETQAHTGHVRLLIEQALEAE